MSSKDHASGSRLVAEQEVHLCNNLRHLLFALADILGRSVSATLIYLEDDFPLESDLIDRLRRHCPFVELIVTSDREQIRQFSNLPKMMPEIFQRNLRIGPAGFRSSLRWVLPLLNEKTFQTGYIYHPGLFAAKPLSFSCDTVIMRESGLNNYINLNVPPLKAFLRLISGLSPFQQVWGEERWINALEVSSPDKLPEKLRARATAVTFSKILGNVSSKDASTLVEIFVPVFPEIELGASRLAILLTQPLAALGLCEENVQLEIYSAIAERLSQLGYKTYVKHHPRERPYLIESGEVLHAPFPLEIWPLLGLPKFDLAVALCSASLNEEDSEISLGLVQLMTPENFSPQGVEEFHKSLDTNLETSLRQ